MRLRVIEEPREFEALREEWRALVAVFPRATLFDTWEWLWTWWETYATTEMRLHLLEVRERGRLVGLLPLYLRRRRLAGFLPRMSTFCIGHGEPEEEEVASEYPELIAAPEHATAVVTRVRECLASSPAVSRLSLRLLRRDGLLHDCLPSRLKRRLEQKAVRYLVSLPSSFEEYLDSLGGRRAKRYRYLLRRLERSGTVEWRYLQGREIDENALECLARLHTERWRRKGRAGAFRGRFLAFHRRLAGRMVGNPEAGILFLNLDGETIGGYYGFRLGGTEYYYQSGYRIGGYQKYSLGTCLVLGAIRHAIGRGSTAFDLMGGGTDSYKASYCQPGEVLLTTVRRRGHLAGCLGRFGSLPWFR